MSVPFCRFETLRADNLSQKAAAAFFQGPAGLSCRQIQTQTQVLHRGNWVAGTNQNTFLNYWKLLSTLALFQKVHLEITDHRF